MAGGIVRLRRFVQDMTRLVTRTGGVEDTILVEGRELLAELVARDDWLPDVYAEPGADSYRQYLLHCDPLERLSVVSFVWGPGQTTPIHDHTVWGLIGILRGAEEVRRFRYGPDGRLEAAGAQRLSAGQVDAVSPSVGDIHMVSNAFDDRVSLSIHVYGANIGAVARHTYDARTGRRSPFISGYSLQTVPNLWDRSTEVRARMA